MELEDAEIRVIELYMMDKTIYYPLAAICSLSTRALLYPLTLVRTRLQVQEGKTVYKGTWDAFYKIRKNEGVHGLYRGIGVSCLHTMPSLIYISVYESVRQEISTKTSIQNTKVRSLVAGGLASCASQFLVVPIDVVSQHVMLAGQQQFHNVNSEKANIQPLQKFNITEEDRKKRGGVVRSIIKNIHQEYGLRGFWKGYGVSLCVYAPHSGLFWFFYDIYGGILASQFPEVVPRVVINTAAAALGGCCATVVTNPVDLVKARLQVRGHSLNRCWQDLKVEGFKKMFTIGMSARLVSSLVFSPLLTASYELLKRFSLKDEFKSVVPW